MNYEIITTNKILFFTEEESLKPQEDATKKGKVKESNQLQHRRIASKLQGGRNNRNKPSKVDETGSETSCSYCLLKGKEEIATAEKIETPAKSHNNFFYIIKEIRSWPSCKRLMSDTLYELF